MTDVAEPELTPRVTEALARDLGKGLARLDPADITRLGLKVGDVVELVGRRRTVGKLMPTYSAYRGRGRVQVDGVTRENAGAAIDQPLQVKPVATKLAELVVLIPMTQPPTESESRSLGRLLAGLPVVVGDRVRVNLIGQRPADFKVVRTAPAGPVVLTANTRLEFGRAGSSESLPRERESFRAFAYEDVGGLKRELARVREIVELPLRFPEVFERLGIAPPKGVLLHGPPGCGKTLIARAVAHETEAAFFSINGPEIIHKFYGESEARLREVFEQAARQAPSIVFLDEIDAIAPKRDRVVGDVEKRVVAQLLTLMDGLAQRAQVVVIAATNLPNALDPALRRPGRFDREIAISIPDRDARRAILDVHRRDMPLASEVNLDQLASVTHGFVGADLEALCREAAMNALRRTLPAIDLDAGSVPPEVLNKLEVTPDDFQVALREVEPSAIREVFVERPAVRWDDVGGLDEAKRRLIEAVAWPLTHAALFAKAGVRPPRGVLLSGPPGCGKTLLARAVANESGAHFIAVSGPEILNKFWGQSEARLRSIFNEARSKAPAIILFDEIDSFASSRDMMSESFEATLVSQLLSLMDGLNNLGRVCVIATTNRPTALDPALRRPGRFDHEIEVGLPDAEARLHILGIHTREMPTDPDLNLEQIASLTGSYSGADLEALCREAALVCMRRTINLRDFEKRIASHQLSALSVTTYDFRTAMKRIGPSIRR
jgi:transitional endoplasmic reticulum ATPase